MVVDFRPAPRPWRQLRLKGPWSRWAILRAAPGSLAFHAAVAAGCLAWLGGVFRGGLEQPEQPPVLVAARPPPELLRVERVPVQPQPPLPADPELVPVFEPPPDSPPVAWRIEVHPPLTIRDLRPPAPPPPVPPAATPPPRPAAPPAPDPEPAATAAAPVLTDPTFDPAVCPPPSYPRAAERRRLEGRVLLRVRVSSEGEVLGVEVEQSTGHAILDEAAVEAVRSWRFAPARRNGRPVPGEARVAFRFHLPT